MILRAYINDKLILEKKNVVTDVGLNRSLDIIIGTNTDAGFSTFELAYSPTVQLPGGDAKLVTSIPTDNTGSSLITVTATTTLNKIGTGQYVIEITATVNVPTGGLTFNEAGVYLGNSSPVLFGYTYWSTPVTLAANSTVTFKWDFNYTIV